MLPSNSNVKYGCTYIFSRPMRAFLESFSGIIFTLLSVESTKVLECGGDSGTVNNQ